MTHRGTENCRRGAGHHGVRQPAALLVASLALALGACAGGSEPKKLLAPDPTVRSEATAEDDLASPELGYDPAALAPFGEVYDCSAPPPRKLATAFRSIRVVRDKGRSGSRLEMSGRVDLEQEGARTVMRTAVSEVTTSGRTFAAAPGAPFFTWVTVSDDADGAAGEDRRTTWEPGNLDPLPPKLAEAIRADPEALNPLRGRYRPGGLVLAMGRPVPEDIMEIDALKAMGDLRTKFAAQTVGKAQLSAGEAVAVRVSVDSSGRIEDRPLRITTRATLFYDPALCIQIATRARVAAEVGTGEAATRQSLDLTLQTNGWTEVR